MSRKGRMEVRVTGVFLLSLLSAILKIKKHNLSGELDLRAFRTSGDGREIPTPFSQKKLATFTGQPMSY
jgi:hypothetical protein